MNKYKFIWGQFYVDSNDSNQLKEFLRNVKKLDKCMMDDSMLFVVFTGQTETSIGKTAESNSRDCLKGRCFLKYKNTQMNSLEKEVKALYDSVKGKLL